MMLYACVCGRAKIGPYKRGWCRKCWWNLNPPAEIHYKLSSSAAIKLPVLMACKHEGDIQQWATCKCDDADNKHIRYCNHPVDFTERCCRGPVKKDSDIASCIECPHRELANGD